jgi:hypothetical protein
MRNISELVRRLPRDLQHDGHSLTELYRQKKDGGVNVYLQNSRLGEVTGHLFRVYRIEIINGREVLGDELLLTPGYDKAVEFAGTTTTAGEGNRRNADKGRRGAIAVTL